MNMTDQEIKAARKRAAHKQTTFPTALSARYDRRMSRIVILLSSGLELAFSAKNTQGLEHTTPANLAGAEITPSGLGVYFPALDVDLYIPALLAGFLGSKKWMAETGGLVRQIQRGYP